MRIGAPRFLPAKPVSFLNYTSLKASILLCLFFDSMIKVATIDIQDGALHDRTWLYLGQLQSRKELRQLIMPLALKTLKLLNYKEH